MESDIGDRDDARSALDAVAADRAALADRATSSPWWFAPATGLVAGVMTAVPAITSGTYVAMLYAFCSIAAIGVGELGMRATGVRRYRSAGPRSTMLLVALVLVLLVAVGGALVLEFTGNRPWIWLVAIGAAVLSAGFTVWYDRIARAELRRAR